MEMAIHLTIVLVVTILRAKYCWTDGTGKVIDVIFVIECGDVGTSKSTITLVAYQVQPPKVVRFA